MSLIEQTVPYNISVITVLYNNSETITSYLQSMYASVDAPAFEVILVDNGSSDDTVEKTEALIQRYGYKNIRLIRSTNDGFGAGNNKGFAESAGKYLLCLNPDTELAPNNLRVMFDFMESHQRVGAATCKLLRPNGELDYASRRSEPNPKIAFYRLSGLQYIFPKKFGSYNMLNKSVDQAIEIEALSGGFMFWRRSLYEQLGGFDDRFFMYAEDNDLCKRIREAGYSIWYYPQTFAIHSKGHSSKQQSGFMLYHFHKSMWLYYQKHYAPQYGWLMSSLVWLGVWGRYAWKRLRNSLRPKEKQFVSK